MENQGNLPTGGLLTNKNSNGLSVVSQRFRDKKREIENYAGQSTRWPLVYKARDDVWISNIISTQGIFLALSSAFYKVSPLWT